MRYKAGYSPSFLLDPETYTFYPFESICEPLLDNNDHVIFSARIAVADAGAEPSRRKKIEKLLQSNSDHFQEQNGNASDDSGKEEEDEEEMLSVPPPPGFLDPVILPQELLRKIYGFEDGQAMPLLVGSSSIYRNYMLMTGLAWPDVEELAPGHREAAKTPRGNSSNGFGG